MTDNGKHSVSRRDFFRQSIKTVTEASDKRSLELAQLWFRPPFASGEIKFLEDCTKCGKCIEACPVNALTPISEKYGLRAAGTPALDLINKACLLCEEWPCVTVCEPNALNSMVLIAEPEDVQDEDIEDIPLRPMALAVIDSARCIAFSGPECGACAHICPVEGALQWDGPKPRIDAEYCVGCGLCRQACITDPKAIRMDHLAETE